VERARSFGVVAETYERFRPDYPDRLADEVLAYAGRPVRTALEIGAGTGKATRVFARRGIAVTASDPDPAMLAELRRHVPSGVTTVRAAFEELPLDAAYDLVYAAASLHWTRPERRWERMAALLHPGGVVASFGGQTRLSDADLEEAVGEARSPYLADDDVPSPDRTPTDSAMQWPATELVDSRLFTDVRQSTIERRRTVPAPEYVGYLSTVSAYLQLSGVVRQQAFDRILEVLPERVGVISDITLHLARRA
jgi:SAM-dependent methyltransferase